MRHAITQYTVATAETVMRFRSLADAINTLHDMAADILATGGKITYRSHDGRTISVSAFGARYQLTAD